MKQDEHLQRGDHCEAAVSATPQPSLMKFLGALSVGFDHQSTTLWIQVSKESCSYSPCRLPIFGSGAGILRLSCSMHSPDESRPLASVQWRIRSLPFGNTCCSAFPPPNSMAGVQVLGPVRFECAADVLKRVGYFFLTVGFLVYANLALSTV